MSYFASLRQSNLKRSARLLALGMTVFLLMAQRAPAQNNKDNSDPHSTDKSKKDRTSSASKTKSTDPGTTKNAQAQSTSSSSTAAAPLQGDLGLVSQGPKTKQDAVVPGVGSKPCPNATKDQVVPGTDPCSPTCTPTPKGETSEADTRAIVVPGANPCASGGKKPKDDSVIPQAK